MQVLPTVTNGVKLLIQLSGLRSDPLQAKWVRDEEDLRIALEQLADNLKYTKSMVGKAMYRNQSTFDFVEDVKRALEYTLLIGDNDKQTAGLRKRNLTMYHLVLEPIIDHLGTLSHEQAIENVDRYINAVYEYACTADINIHFEDALVAQVIIKNMVQERETARKVKLAEKRRGKRGKKKEEDITDIPAEVEDDLVDETLPILAF